MHTANSEPNTPNTQYIENFLFSIDSSITVIYTIEVLNGAEKI